MLDRLPVFRCGYANFRVELQAILGLIVFGYQVLVLFNDQNPSVFPFLLDHFGQIQEQSGLSHQNSNVLHCRHNRIIPSKISFVSIVRLAQ